MTAQMIVDPPPPWHIGQILTIILEGQGAMRKKVTAIGRNLEDTATEFAVQDI